MIENVANLLTAMMRGTAVGMGEAHDGMLRRRGATTGVMSTGDVIVIAGAAIGGRTTTGATDGPRAGRVIEETFAIDLCGVIKIGIAGEIGIAGSRVVPIAGCDPSFNTEGVKQLSLS